MRWVDTRAPEMIEVRRHSGGGSVAVWGGFCGGKKTTLKFSDGNVTSQSYVATLGGHLQPSFDPETQIFQQDNASPHTAALTNAWFQDQYIDVLTWPALSPDINPIGNVWGYLTHAVYAGGRQFYSTNELKKAVQKVWDDMPDSYLLTLVESMPNRVEALKEQGRACTSY
jgi:hypothetical protein